MILVVGASGKLGSEVTRQLLRQETPGRALSRDPVRLQELRDLGAEVAQGDLRDPNSLARAVRV
jgi:dihydroflavonol-4-reductase